MGSSKLLLPWGDGTIIDKLLTAWTGSNVAETIVVIRGDDHELTAACKNFRVRVVHPDRDPRDMKESVQCGLQEIASIFAPADGDRCFVAPADLPTLSSAIIDRLIATESDQNSIVVPRFGDRIGHPALIPWPLTDEVFALGEHEGIDQIIKRHPIIGVPFPAAQRIKDVDTPQEYQQLRPGNS